MRRRLALAAAQRRELEAIRDRDPRPYLRERAAALLLVAAGHAPHAVARRGLLKPRDPDTVYAWLAAYERGGAAGLVQRPRGHRGFPPSAGRRVGRDGAPAARAARGQPEPVAAGGPEGGRALAG